MITDQQLEFFRTRVDRGEPMVLATVFETEGSTYSKAGDQLLIDKNGIFRGLLSGGCLEGDLAVRAQIVLESGNVQTVNYDFTVDDEIWGLGVGCEGIMRVFLQPLLPQNDWEPFHRIAGAALRGERVAVATIVEGDGNQTPGTSAVAMQSDGSGAKWLQRLAERALVDGKAQYGRHDFDGSACQILRHVIEPPPALLILGAGPDAEPIVRIATELGWRCTISDHRPAYIDGGNFSAAETHCLPAEELSDELSLSRFDFALVMSHHLTSDRAYLSQLAASSVPYIGLLGPAARRNRLLKDLGDQARSLEERLHGPVGLDIGGRGPGPIAVSVIAEMQSKLALVRGS